MYTILALDLDGTLTTSKKQITAHSKQAIRGAMEKGVKIVLASGRPVLGIAPVARELGLFGHDAYILAYNGGQLISCKDESVVWERTVSLEAIHACFSYAKDNNLAALAYDENGIITEMPDDEHVHIEAYNNAIPIRKVENLNALMVLPQPKVMIVGDPRRLQKAKVDLDQLVGSGADLGFSEPCFMEITAKGVQKASSLDVLLSLLEKTRETLMVVGDGLNDVPMFKIAGLAVAMANASDEVKAHAKAITTSNDEDGVALAIEKYILA